MNKLYVPKELSRELKDAGFDMKCFGIYTPVGNLVYRNPNKDYVEYPEDIPAPLYTQVIEWFNRNHRIDISCHISTSGRYALEIWTWLGDNKGWSRKNGEYGFESREAAYLKGFEEAFKILFNVQITEHT